MILKNIQIKNFKSISDSGLFELDDLTCLVGKNESGKTAILQSINKLNPAFENDSEFVELEFPRMFLYDYTDDNRPEEVIITQWLIEDYEYALLESRLGVGRIKSKEVTVKKGYKNTIEFDIDLDYQGIVNDFISSSDLFQEEIESLKGINNTSNLISKLKELSSDSERFAGLLARLQKAFPEGYALGTAKKILADCLPKFLYFSQYEVMKGEVSLQKISKDIASDTLTMPDRIFLALLEMAGTDVNEIQNIGQFEALVAKLEAVSNRLTREIFNYWSQNKHLSIEFRFDAARPEDPAPFDTGYVFRTRIKNTRHGVTVSFDDRSAGFVWFFSFLVWFSQVKSNYGENLIILLDEPGLNLHAKAQSDLLRYIKEKLVPDHQVIYYPFTFHG